MSAAGGVEELERAVARAGEPLHRLDQHRGDRVVHRRVERGDVVERHLPAQRHAGAPRRLLVARPVGAGERRGRAAVPAAPHRDDRLAPGVPPGQMERVLVGLRARVAEEDPPERRRTELGQLLRQRLALRQRHGRRIEQELRRLLGDGPHHVGMAVAGRGHGVAAVGIEPLVAVRVHQPRAVAADRADRHRGVDGKERGYTGSGPFASLRVTPGGRTAQGVPFSMDRSPRPSGRRARPCPSARFIAWIAWPPAPFTRLSIATVTWISSPLSLSTAWISA